jgi:nucleoside 2-deoxyribosyltransferase
VAKTKSKQCRIFYSWQSDLPTETNLNAIRNGLRKAIKKLQPEFPNLKLVLDEATRDTSGAIKISDKIIEKLDVADIVVADVTSVTSRRAKRQCPNPNVTYELGYGVAQVGWERVILMFNSTLARFPQDMPFDFQQNRATPYQLAADSSATVRAVLIEKLRVALKAILVRDPKRPAEIKGLSPERIAHDRDTKQMKWLMSSLHLPTIDEFILELPGQVRSRAIWYWEGFHALMENSLFELNDPVLKNAVTLFYEGWARAFSHVDRYNDTGIGKMAVFTWPRHIMDGAQAQADWDDILEAREQMRAGLDRILERLRADQQERDDRRKKQDRKRKATK